MTQQDMNNTSSKRRGEGRSFLSAYHCKTNGFHLWRTALKDSVFVCLRRVLGKLNVMRNHSTKCVCLVVSKDRKHKLDWDCTESCKGAGYGKRFFWPKHFFWLRFRVSAYWQGASENGLRTGKFWLRLRTAQTLPRLQASRRPCLLLSAAHWHVCRRLQPMQVCQPICSSECPLTYLSCKRVQLVEAV